MNIYENPYPRDSDKYKVWKVLIKNDFDGFLNQSWSDVEKDYLSEGFHGINMNKSLDSSNWQLSFPTLESYQKQWQADSINFAKKTFISDPREIFYKTTRLENFEFFSHQMMVHKIFNGKIKVQGAEDIELNWRSLFILKRTSLGWKINSFCGYIKE